MSTEQPQAWRYQKETDYRPARLGLTQPDGVITEQLYFLSGHDPKEKGRVLADALNVHAATGLTSSQLLARVQELEASQAQRVPLSDEAKKKLLREWSYSQLTGKGDFLDGVEAAERAHGITQEKQG